VSTATAASEQTAAVAARSLTKRFGGRVALAAVNFEVRSGQLVAVIGPNGAGKTTLLSIVAGVLAPDEGEVLRPPGARPFGWVPQQVALYSKLSVAENLRLFARLEKLADPDAAVTRMVAETGLEERADEEVGHLSGGNQQRVNIGIGLLGEPPVLLLDEPSAALDPRQRERLWEFISRLAERGTTVMFSTHDVAEAERYGERVLVLADGELLFDGTPGELERAVGGGTRDFESAFVSFLRERGH
jgi:ABC-2 type transport system ATP-binding protein